MKVDLGEIVETILRMQTETICLKFREAAKVFVEREDYGDNSEIMLKCTDALLYKFTLCVINLEFLWKIAEKANSNREISGVMDWNNTNSIIDSIFLEGTIIQIRAFIDFAQKLACVRLGYLKPIDGTKDFYKILNKVNNEESKLIEKSFLKMDEEWGNLIRNLRDKILHYGIIKTNHEYRPQIQSKSYEVFAQEQTNNMFLFLTKLSWVLFNVEWVSGTIDDFKKKYSR